mgnify:FL=1
MTSPTHVVRNWNAPAPTQVSNQAIINLENVAQLTHALNGEVHPRIANLNITPSENGTYTGAQIAKIDRATTLAYADTLNTTTEEVQLILKGHPMPTINLATQPELAELAKKQEANEAKLADIARRLQEYRNLNVTKTREASLLYERIQQSTAPASDLELQQVMREYKSCKNIIASNKNLYDKLILAHQKLNNAVQVTRDRIHAEKCALEIASVNKQNKEIEEYLNTTGNDISSTATVDVAGMLEGIYNNEVEDNDHIFDSLTLEQEITELRNTHNNKE